jgi:electron transport complex protein RnfD
MPMQQSANIVSAPFIESQQTISAVMRQVIYALVPGIIVAFYFFGWEIVTNLVIACTSALMWETFALYLRQRPVKIYLMDNSAVVTAILLGLALPPMAPWWLVLTGTFFAIVVAKQLYGGLGFNTLNPAMAGYAVLMISFPKEMSAWVAPVTFPVAHIGFMATLKWVFLNNLPDNIALDALTSATPLDYMHTEIGRGLSFNAVRQSPAVGILAGKGVEWINLAILSGGVWLWYKKMISWHIPISVLTGIGLLSEGFYRGGAQWLQRLVPGFDGFLLAILPPGAFMGLAVFIAAKNIIDKRIRQRQKTVKAQNPQYTPNSVPNAR